jgi:hypothetical protein
MTTMETKFTVPLLAKPWVDKIVTALLVAGITWLVTWLNTKGIDAKLPAIEEQVQATRADIKEMRATGMLMIEKK